MGEFYQKDDDFPFHLFAPLTFVTLRACVQFAETRKSILDTSHVSGGLLVGTHFSEPCAGHIETHGEIYKFVPIEPDGKLITSKDFNVH